MYLEISRISGYRVSFYIPTMNVIESILINLLYLYVNHIVFKLSGYFEFYASPLDLPKKASPVNAMCRSHILHLRKHANNFHMKCDANQENLAD